MSRGFISSLIVIALLSHSTHLTAQPAAKLGDPAFQKRAILSARFGGVKGVDLKTRADSLAAKINQRLFGQEDAALFVQDRVQAWVQDMDRSDKPTVFNLLGLYGTGKGVMVEVVAEHLGVPIIRIDSQQYADDQMDFGRKIVSELRAHIRSGSPVILQINETDKIYEITAKEGVEVTNPLIGLINEMVEEGTLPLEKGSDQKLKLKNVLIAMTMNMAPADVDRFAPIDSTTQKPKNFYRLTYDDFADMDRRMQEDPNLKYTLLSHLFRGNTVDRLAPVTMLTRASLNVRARYALVQSVVELEAQKLTSARAARLDMDWSKSYIDFLVQNYTFAPGGARGLTSFVEQLTKQLIGVGLRMPSESGAVSDRPRRLEFAASGNGVQITAVDFKRIAKQLVPAGRAEIQLSYDSKRQRFQNVEALPELPDLASAPKEAEERGLTKKAIRAARFPSKTTQLKGVRKYLNGIFFGRHSEIDILSKDLSRYLARRGATQKTVTQRTFAGLHGEGKSDLPEMAAKYLGLPVVRISLKDYSSPEVEAKVLLEQRLASALEKARDESEDGENPKYVLIFDELDKLREIDDQGHAHTLPAMGLINTLLSEGHVETTTEDFEHLKIDIRDAYVIFTMNFKHDLLALSADPRLTTPTDVREAMDRTFESPAATYEVLKTLFVPSTISRFLPFLTIVKSLNESEFHKLAQAKARAAIAEYFQALPSVGSATRTRAKTAGTKTYDSVEDFLVGAGFGDLVEDHESNDASVDESDIEADEDAEGLAAAEFGKNGITSAASVDVRLGHSYTKYLYQETIVPSEGGRYTTLAVHQRVSSDLDEAMRAFPQNSPYAGEPIRLFLEFDPQTSKVASSFVPLKEAQHERVAIESHGVARMFKPLTMSGPVPLYRMHVSVHEYGHAFFAMLFGFRFNSILVAELEPGAGGVVSYRIEPALGANKLLAELMMFLGSRAMERAILTRDPSDPKSIFEASADGPSEDIKQATKQLYQMLHELGLNPFGGTMDRSGGESTQDSFASFEALSADEIQQLRTILRRLENQLVRILIKDFSKSWLKKKIERIARAGRMTEEEFYALHRYPYPGLNSEFIGGRSPTLEIFKNVVIAETEAVRAARDHQRGTRNLTAEQYLNEVSGALMKWLAKGAGAAGKIEDCEGLLEAGD